MHGSLGHRTLLSREVSCETFWPGCVSGSVTFASCEKIFVRPRAQAGFLTGADHYDILIFRAQDGRISTAAELGRRWARQARQTATGLLGSRGHRLTSPHPEVPPNAPATLPLLQSCELSSEPPAPEVPEQFSRRRLQLVPQVTELEQQPSELPLEPTTLTGRGGHGAG
jgi:hypothetical protein